MGRDADAYIGYGVSFDEDKCPWQHDYDGTEEDGYRYGRHQMVGWLTKIGIPKDEVDNYEEIWGGAHGWSLRGVVFTPSSSYHSWAGDLDLGQMMISESLAKKAMQRLAEKAGWESTRFGWVVLCGYG